MHGITYSQLPEGMQYRCSNIVPNTNTPMLARKRAHVRVHVRVLVYVRVHVRVRVHMRTHVRLRVRVRGRVRVRVRSPLHVRVGVYVYVCVRVSVRRSIKTRWWTPFEPYADNTMYKTSLWGGPLRHLHKSRYTSHEINDFLKKIVNLPARQHHPTLGHRAGASKRRVQL